MLVTTQFQTTTCDECGKTATFQVHQQGVAPEVLEENPWLKAARNIATADGRKFFVCSDECDVKHTATGVRNPVEQSRVVTASNPAAIAQAAAAAKAATEATDAIKSGRGGQVTI